MIEIQINGQTVHLQSESEKPFREVLKDLRTDFSAEHTLISSLKVNGRELTDVSEELLLDIPIGQVGLIELWTTHRNAIVHETVDTLLAFLPELMVLCQRTAAETHKAERIQLFNRLLNGIETFFEAVTTVKVTYNIPAVDHLAALETQTYAIMEELLKVCQTDQDECLNEILVGELTAHLREWMAHGIPALLNALEPEH